MVLHKEELCDLYNPPIILMLTEQEQTQEEKALKPSMHT
jgi:hypothetical protein